LINSDGTYYVSTPGTVSVDRDYGALTVSCQKDGYDAEMMEVNSSTKGMAFGNILIGGVIGAGVDVATGAAYDYPSEIIHPLDCRSEAQLAAAPTTGQHDKEALALVDTNSCEEPSFVFMDGENEIYRSQCLDGKVGVISCSDGACKPVNVSAPAGEQVAGALPQHSDQVQNIGRARDCYQEFHATDITPDSETWMVKCASGRYMVVQCTEGGCSERQ
jgi:hypothetical protein